MGASLEQCLDAGDSMTADVVRPIPDRCDPPTGLRAGGHSEPRDLPPVANNLAATTKTGAGKRAERQVRVMQFCVDSVAAASGWAVAAAVDSSISAAGAFDVTLVAAVTAVVLCGAASQRVYSHDSRALESSNVRGLWHASAAGGLASLVLPSTSGVEPSVPVAFLGTAASFMLLFAAHACVCTWVAVQRRRHRLMRHTIVIGTDPDAVQTVAYMQVHPEAGYEVVGTVGEQLELSPIDVPWLGPLEQAVDAACAAGADTVLISLGNLESDYGNTLVRRFLFHGFDVRIPAHLSGITCRRVFIEPFATQAALSIKPISFNRRQMVAKRALDVCGAFTLLLLTSPILIAAAFAIRREDRGPVLFRQIRVGRDGRPFTMLKLRTMSPGAEARLDDLEASNERTGPLFKLTEDPRVTRVGRALRITSIDELPQLINVLRGEMSLVGPRPALPSEFEQFDEDLQGRAKVLPGLTGLWQVESRDDPSFEVYRTLDLFYVENWCLLLDIELLARTAAAVVRRTYASRRRRGGSDPAIPVLAAGSGNTGDGGT